MPRGHDNDKRKGKKASVVASSGSKKKRHPHLSAKEKARKSNRSKKCAWEKYFDLSRAHFHALSALKEIQKDAVCSVTIPKHIASKYIELVSSYDKEERECPICLEDVTFDTAKLTDCGHLFHSKCIEPLPTCPVCCGKYAKKDKSGGGRDPSGSAVSAAAAAVASSSSSEEEGKQSPPPTQLPVLPV